MDTLQDFVGIASAYGKFKDLKYIKSEESWIYNFYKNTNSLTSNTECCKFKVDGFQFTVFKTKKYYLTDISDGMNSIAHLVENESQLHNVMKTFKPKEDDLPAAV